VAAAATGPLDLEDPGLRDRFEAGRLELARATFRILGS
jgi:hypothetical protein